MLDLRGLWDVGNPSVSEARIHAALPSASPRDRHLLMTQLARAIALQGRLDDAIALLAATDPVDHEVAARTQLERGRVLRAQGDAVRARPELEAAVRHAVGCDAVHVEALHTLAIVVGPEERSALREEALRVARASPDLRARDWDAQLLTDIGRAEAEAGQWQDALASFEVALGARERQGDAARVRDAQWLVGWALRNLDRPTEALDAQRRLRAELEAIGESAPHVDDEIALLEQGLRR